MRYLLIALMIVLLPLRGWAGNAMTIDMATQQVSQATASTAAMPADCPMQVQALAANVTQKNSVSGHCHSCDTCQLCLALAASTHMAWPAEPMNRPSAPLLGSNAFRSANTTAGYKPPIS